MPGEFEAENDPVNRQAIAARIQRAAYEDGTFLIAGQCSSPAAWRKELGGVVDFGLPILQNIERRSASSVGGPVMRTGC